MSKNGYFSRIYKRAFTKTFALIGFVTTVLSSGSAYYLWKNQDGDGTINLLEFLVPTIIFASGFVAFFIWAQYSVYKEEKEKWENMKAEDYYKYNDEAKADKLHRIFYNLLKEGEEERPSAPLRWKIFYEKTVEKTLIDSFPDRERLHRYRRHIKMIGGETEDEIIKNRFEGAMDLIEGAIKEDFYGLIQLL